MMTATTVCSLLGSMFTRNVLHKHLEKAGIFFLFVLTQQIIAPYLMNPFVSLVHFIVVIVRKVLPAFMLAKWLIATTDVSEFVAAMWKCKIPQNIIITTSFVIVSVHFSFNSIVSDSIYRFIAMIR